MSIECLDGPGGVDEGQSEQVALGSTPVPTGVPARVLIAPWGQVASTSGPFVMDEEAGRAVLEAFRQHGTDIPVDYEHQSLGGAYASPSGQAPAAGWIRALFACGPGTADEPGLYADVSWTESGRTRLEAREYRYLSPVVLVRKSDRRVQALHSAALTNKPAIVGMRPIVNRASGRAGESCTGAAGGELREPGTHKERVEKRMETTAGMKESEPAGTAGAAAIEQLRLRLGLTEEDDPTAVLVAASDRLAALMAEAVRREARERVEAAFRAGKLTGAQQEWAMGLAMRDPSAFEEWLASAPVVVAFGRTEAPGGSERTSGRNRAAVIASARAVYRGEPALALLTNEDAWVEEALREAERIE